MWRFGIYGKWRIKNDMLEEPVEIHFFPDAREGKRKDTDSL